jgi:hypothetical protein
MAQAPNSGWPAAVAVKQPNGTWQYASNGTAVNTADLNTLATAGKLTWLGQFDKTSNNSDFGPGDYITEMHELDGMADGTTLNMVTNEGSTYTLLKKNGEWVDDADGVEMNESDLLWALGQDLTYKAGPGAVPEEDEDQAPPQWQQTGIPGLGGAQPKVTLGSPIATGQFVEDAVAATILPQGTVVYQPKSDLTWKKLGAGWTSTSGENESTLTMLLGGPVTVSELPEKFGTTAAELEAAPVGSVFILASSGTVRTKIADGTWATPGEPTGWTSDLFNEGALQGGILAAPTGAAPDTNTLSGLLKTKFSGAVNAGSMKYAPAGARVQMPDGSYFHKSSDGKWYHFYPSQTTSEGSYNLYDSAITQPLTNGQLSWAPVDKWSIGEFAVTDKADLAKAAVGATIQRKFGASTGPGTKYTKAADGSWYDEFGSIEGLSDSDMWAKGNEDSLMIWTNGMPS